MTPWRSEFTPKAEREFRKLTREAQGLIVAALRRLAIELGDPNEPKQSKVKALRGDLKGEYRLRVGDFRVRYRLEGDRLIILVLHVGNRRDVYRS